VGDRWLHEAVCRQRLTFVSYFVTVLYCKPHYSSEAASVANSRVMNAKFVFLSTFFVQKPISVNCLVIPELTDTTIFLSFIQL
jgi:hypothetical protein